MRKHVIDRETGMTELDLFENQHCFEDWNINEDTEGVSCNRIVKKDEPMVCPEDRCPLCWNDGIDSLKAKNGSYCEEHEMEMK